MATKKKPCPPQLASSRVARALSSVEFAKAIQNPEFDAAGYPYTCQGLIDHPKVILRPEWTPFIVKILKRHGTDPLTCRHLIAHPDCIRDPAFTPIIVEILKSHVVDYPRRRPSSQDIAFMVDLEMLFGRLFDDIIAEVAKATGKSGPAVKKAHDRYGRQRS
jgi:hypothetical protein